MPRTLTFTFVALFFTTITCAQDTLPNFSLAAKSNGKVLISWHNPFVTVTQLSIQRSSDSLKNFTTLLSVPDPNIPENGFVDGKAPRMNMFYRLFIVLENGRYLFSKSRRAIPDSAIIPEKNLALEENDLSLSRVESQRISYLPGSSSAKSKIALPSRLDNTPKVEVARTIYIMQNDSIVRKMAASQVPAFRDSIIKKTKDTLMFVSMDTILVKPFVPKEVYKISNYVFTGKDGNILISLPDVDRRKYMVKFLEMNMELVLEIKEVRKKLLIIDKTNFVHAGWFRFELYEEGKLKEKNKLFIPKDF